MSDHSKDRPQSRVLPALTRETTAFWTAGETGALMIHRCRSCSRLFHPPAPVCFRCRSVNVGPDRVSGHARVATFSINVHQWFPGFPPPYVVAIVELDDDPDVRLTTNIVGCPVDEVVIGMPVAVVFERRDDVWIPLFRPVPDPLGKTS
jgi:uncharacterized protein